MSPHVWIYPDRNSRRDNDGGRWGGEVVSKEKMRREAGGGPGRDEIS